MSDHELKNVPPEVIVSDGGPITADMMGEMGEDEMSPEVLDLLLKQRADKLRREQEANKKLDKEKEYPMIYGGFCTGANEFTVLVYTAIKILFYLGVLALAARAMTGSYSAGTCRISGSKCLKTFANQTVCVDTSEIACAQECSLHPGPDAPKGCLKFGASSFTYECITPYFDDICFDLTQCPPAGQDAVKTFLLAQIIVMGIAVGLDAIYILPMLLFKGTHIDEFDRLTGFQKICILYSRVWALVTHWVWAAGLVMGIMVLMAVNSNKDVCKLSPTISVFFDDSYLVALACFAAHGVIIIVGTYFRARVPLRGQLYRPSNDATITFPMGLDCKECRERPRPRWGTAIFKPHMQKENVVGCVCNCCSCLLDTACLFTMHILGWSAERVYKHRHFIGP